MCWFLSVALMSALASGPSSERPAAHSPNVAKPLTSPLLTAPDRRVRTTDSRIQRLLEDGMQRSVTFAQLVTALNTTDVIVYLEPVHYLRNSVAGRMILLPVGASQRYLRIQIRSDLTAVDTIALMGHELQHALEIAAAREVRDESALVSLYTRIGFGMSDGGSGTHNFDTAAAQRTGRQVRFELAG